MNNGLNFFLPFFIKFGWLGNWLFFLIALIECIPFAGGFIPGGTLITIGGLLASRGYFNPLALIIFASLGAIIGDYLGYWTGRWSGNWLESKNIVKKETLEKGRIFFVKYGNKSVFWGRFIGATRAVMPFTAGASKMKASSFLLWTSVSSLIFVSFNVLLGYFSGSLIGAIIQEWSSGLGLIIIILAAASLIYWLTKKHDQSASEYFRKQSRAFTNKLMTSRLFIYLDERYPAIDELSQAEKNKEFIYGLFLWILLLSIIYITALILNLF